MPVFQIDSLPAVAKTLLIPLWFRAQESMEPNPIVSDHQALAIVSQINYDFSKFGKVDTDQVFSMMRCREFDRCTSDFLTEYPGGGLNLIEKCNGLTFTIENPSIRHLPDYLALFCEFFPIQKRKVTL